jgi:DNA gyrase subunit A
VRSGRAVRFPESTVRPMGRTASGVRGITLSGSDDRVIGMITVLNQSDDILVVSEHGYGKRSAIEDYRITNRGGKGVKTINVTEKTGKLIALKGVIDRYDLMIITQAGNVLRIPVSSLRVMGRATQGVRLINIRENDKIASVAYVEVDEEDELIQLLESELPEPPSE